MNRTTVLAAFGVAAAYFFVSMMFADYAVPVFSLPLIGDVLVFKPFEALAPYTVFIGAALAVSVAYMINKDRRKTR